jgi:hypothetical protein
MYFNVWFQLLCVVWVSKVNSQISSNVRLNISVIIISLNVDQ